MGFLFGGGGSSAPPPSDQPSQPSPQESFKKQEQKVQKEEIKERRKINQRMRKMKTGGMRQLLTQQDRETPALGNPMNVQRTLGPDRNPR